MDPEVLLQHVLSRKGFVTLVTAVALHTYMKRKAQKMLHLDPVHIYRVSIQWVQTAAISNGIISMLMPFVLQFSVNAMPTV